MRAAGSEGVAGDKKSEMRSMHGSGLQSTKLDNRVWRLSGFSPEGREISHEFAGLHGGTGSVPYREISLIGRDPCQCQFFIDHMSVSRVHAELRFFVGRGVGLRDLSSRNGTFVNGKQVFYEFEMLDVMHKVKIGLVELMVSYPR